MDESDGSRWRWNGSSWDLVDPPGTHQDAIHRHDLVVPLLSLAGQLDRDRVDEAEAIAALLAFPGCDRAALLEAAAMVEAGDERSRRIGRLLRGAAESP